MLLERQKSDYFRQLCSSKTVDFSGEFAESLGDRPAGSICCRLPSTVVDSTRIVEFGEQQCCQQQENAGSGQTGRSNRQSDSIAHETGASKTIASRRGPVRRPG